MCDARVWGGVHCRTSLWVSAGSGHHSKATVSDDHIIIESQGWDTESIGVAQSNQDTGHGTPAAMILLPLSQLTMN